MAGKHNPAQKAAYDKRNYNPEASRQKYLAKKLQHEAVLGNYDDQFADAGRELAAMMALPALDWPGSKWAKKV